MLSMLSLVVDASIECASLSVCLHQAKPKMVRNHRLQVSVRSVIRVHLRSYLFPLSSQVAVTRLRTVYTRFFPFVYCLGTFTLKSGLAQMTKGGLVMDVVNAAQAKIAEEAGVCINIMSLYSRLYHASVI